MTRKFIAATTFAITANSANAAVIIDIVQTGSSVTATATGKLNLTGAQQTAAISYAIPYIEADRAAIFSGTEDQDQLVDYLTFTAVPSAFGTSSAQTAPSSVSGTFFGITESVAGTGVPALILLQGFTSGSSVNFAETWSNHTLASLGLNSGTYTYSLPNDTVTINIGSVPEAASWAMMILGMGAIGFALRRRQRVATRVSYAI